METCLRVSLKKLGIEINPDYRVIMQSMIKQRTAADNSDMARFRCARCGSYDTSIEHDQRRSADEGTTTILKCAKCKYEDKR